MWGVFGNAGISDGDPNPIDWSIIVGIGGSSPIRNRKLDTFGIATTTWASARALRTSLRQSCRCATSDGLEVFYNLGVTPWCHLTTDLQVITPVLERADTSLVLGLRAKIDF